MSTVVEPRITPYWHRMPSYFAYPLRRPALDLLLITVALGLFSVFVPYGLLAGAASLAMLFILAKYGYESLHCTAAGDTDPPPLSEALTGEGYVLPLKQFAVLVALILLAVFAWRLGGVWLGGVAVLTITLLFPASVILLGVERSFLTAVNPLRLLGVATAIGWPYLGLFGLLLCVQIASGTSIALVDRLMPGESGLAINLGAGMFLGNYFTLMAFHMLGYVVYQYHENLGYSAFAPEAEGIEGELTLFHELVEKQQYQAALAELRDVMHRYPEEAATLANRMLQLARLSGDSDTLVREGGAAIGERLKAGRAGEAADLYLECRQARPGFLPLRAEHHEPIARELRARGRTREALELLNGMHQRFPDSPHVPGAYVLAARLFLDDGGKPAQAERILRFLESRYPDNPYEAEVASLLRGVRQTGG